MSPTLWTILVLVIPNGIGFVVFFVARQARKPTGSVAEKTFWP